MDDKKMTPQDAERFEPMAKVLAANGVAQSFSFTSERKYLNGISGTSYPFKLELATMRTDLPADPYWIKISQVGKPIDNSAEKCFTAIQKILTTCFMPTKAQLIFLVHGEGGIYEMYLGIRSRDKTEITSSFADSLKNFIVGLWPGMKCERVEGSLDIVKNSINKSYEFINAVTGIPSMESQYKATYPATLDALLVGMQNKNFTYLVVADPIEETEVDGILYNTRDFQGQAESLKSFNFSKNVSNSISQTLSESKAVCEGRMLRHGWDIVGSGLALASFIFPPAGAVTKVISIGAGASRIIGSNLFADFSLSLTKGGQLPTSGSEGTTDSTSQTQGESMSTCIVNKQIEAVSEHLRNHSKRYENGKALGCWSVGVYLMAEKMQDIQGASMQLKSIVSGQESVFEPVRVHRIEDIVEPHLSQTLGSMDNPLIKVRSTNGEYFAHPLGDHFDDLRTVLTTKELSYFINFPLRSVPGISVVSSSPEFSLNEQEVVSDGQAIEVGKLLYGGSETNMGFKIPVGQLSRHMLLSGINGSGKTNTVQAILNGIGDLPFLVIEPAKTEYVDWAIEYNKTHTENQIDIYIPGCTTYKGNFKPKSLSLNPFEIVWLKEEQEPNVLAHIDRLKSTFASAFPMYDILPVLMEELIYAVYQKNWLDPDAPPKYGKTNPPSLFSMSTHVEDVLKNRGYKEDIGKNLKACLNTRIDSLRRGWKDDLLNCRKSTPWGVLFGKPCVINLSYVGDDVDKGFIMALILQFLYEYRQAQSEIGEIDFNDNGCRHLTIIEEAHRVMSRCENPTLPQYKSAMMFSNMLSEIRAYGEGMLLVDQVPTRLISDAIKNTNFKIIHRLVAEDDVRAIGESMGLSPEQRMIIPKLLTGQCVINSSLSTEAYWLKVNKVK